MQELIQFQWYHCTAGYEIIEAPEEYFESDVYGLDWLPEWAFPFRAGITVAGERFTDRAFIVPRDETATFYRPLDEDRALFRNFAALDGSPESFVKFAGKYGPISDLRGDARFPGGGGHGSSVTALSQWKKQHELMRTAVEAWKRGMKGGNFEGLFESFNPLTVTPWFKLSLGRREGEPAPVSFLQPKDLQEAMWLQFGMAAAGNALFRQCEVCGKWFRIGPGGDKKISATVCSGRCRTMKYERRKAGRPIQDKGVSR